MNYVKVLKNFFNARKKRILRSHKISSLSTLKTFCVNSFVNLKIELLQKIKTTSFLKLAVVTVKQSTSVDLNGL